MRYVELRLRLYRRLRRLFPVWGGRRLVRLLLAKANALSVRGLVQAAVQAAQEAVDEGARIASFDPERYGGALIALAELLVRQGRCDEAQAVIDRVGEVSVRVRAAAPVEGDLLVGWCSQVRSGLLQRQGRHGEALDAALEAVRLFRIHLPQRPRKCRAGLAGALEELGYRYSERARHADAVEAFREAVRLYRRLGRPLTGRWTYREVPAVASLALALGASGNGRAALREAELVTGSLRLLVRSGREGFRPKLAQLVNESAAWHQEQGDVDKAVRAAAEAVEHYRLLADRDPDAYRLLLAVSHHNLVCRQDAARRVDGADPAPGPATLVGQFLRVMMLHQAEEHDRLRDEVGRTETADDAEFVRIAFGLAVRHFFGSGLDRGLVDAFMAGMRQAYDIELPLAAIEVLVRHELGDEVSASDIDLKTQTSACLTTLVAIADLLTDTAAVDAILTRAEAVANERRLNLRVLSTEGQ